MEAITEYSLISFQSRFRGGRRGRSGVFFLEPGGDGFGVAGFRCGIQSLLRIQGHCEEVYVIVEDRTAMIGVNQATSAAHMEPGFSEIRYGVYLQLKRFSVYSQFMRYSV